MEFMQFYVYIIFHIWQALTGKVWAINYLDNNQTWIEHNKNHISYLIVCDKRHSNLTNMSVVWRKVSGLGNLHVHVNTIYITDNDESHNYFYECSLDKKRNGSKTIQVFFEIMKKEKRNVLIAKIVNNSNDLIVQIIPIKRQAIEFDFNIFKKFDKNSIMKNPLSYIYIFAILISVGLAILILIIYFICRKSNIEENDKVVEAMAVNKPNYELHAGGIHNETPRNIHGNSIYRGEEKRLINYADPKCPCHTENIPYDDGDKAYFSPDTKVPVYPMQDKNKVFSIPSPPMLNIANLPAPAVPVVNHCKFNHTVKYESKLMALNFKDIHAQMKLNQNPPSKFKKFKKAERINIARGGPDFQRCENQDMERNIRDPIDQYFDDLKNAEKEQLEKGNENTKAADPKPRVDRYTENINPPKPFVGKLFTNDKSPINYLNRNIEPIIPSTVVVPPYPDRQRNPLSQFPPACTGCTDQYIPGFDGPPARNPAFENPRCQFHITGQTRRPNLRSFSNTTPVPNLNYYDNPNGNYNNMVKYSRDNHNISAKKSVTFSRMNNKTRQ